MPDDAACGTVDQALKVAVRFVHAAVTPIKQWTIYSVIVTLSNGGGAQSAVIALQSGTSREVAMLLLKQGYSMKEAHTILCGSATEQRALIQRIA